MAKARSTSKAQSPSVPVAHRLANLVQFLLKFPEGVSMVELSKLEGYDDKTFGRGAAQSEEEKRERQALRRRFQRDVKALEEIGVQVEALKARADDKGDLYRIKPDATLLRPIKLAADEHMLLQSLQSAYPDLADTDFGALVLSALIKLRTGSAASLGQLANSRRSAAAMQRALVSDQSKLPQLDACLYAFAHRKPIRFKYQKASDATPKQRTVEPWGVVRRGSQGYLVGLDRDEGEQRIFRLSRMKGMPSVLEKEAAYALPKGFKLEDAFPATLLKGGRTGGVKNARIKFNTDVGFIIANDFAGQHDVRLAKNGSAELRIEHCYPDELFRYLAEFAGHFEILAPKGLVQSFEARLRETLERYS